MTPELILNCVAMLGGAVAFLAGLREYRATQRWKRAEWLAKLIEDFEKDLKVGEALWVLDWCERHIDSLYWNEQIVRDALTVHTTMPDGARFTSDAARIRDGLDAFFAFMVRLQGYIEDGLIDEGPAMRYFGYWIIRAHEMDQYENLKSAMDAYICAYSDAGAFEALYRCAIDHHVARTMYGAPATKALP